MRCDVLEDTALPVGEKVTTCQDKTLGGTTNNKTDRTKAPRNIRQTVHTGSTGSWRNKCKPKSP